METPIQANLDNPAHRKFSIQPKSMSANCPQVAAILPSIIITILRIYLSRENERRDKLEAQNLVSNNGLVETINNDGSRETRVVDNNQLDLTDRENLKL